MTVQRKISKRFSLSVTSVTFISGLLAFVGYWLKIDWLCGFYGQAAMNPVSALCLILSGAWLFLYQQQPAVAKTVQPYIASIILVTGIFKIVEYLGISSINFDKWLFFGILNNEEYFRVLAPNSALLLMLCGITVATAYRDVANSRFCNDIFKVTGFLVSYLAIIGYIYNLEIVYRLGNFIPMAMNSAIGYMAFFTVALIEMPPGNFMKVIGSRHVGGRMARKAIPVILLIPLAFGYFRLVGEKDALFDQTYGTALETAFMVLMVLVFVYIYARRLNQQDKNRSNAELMIAESEHKYRTLVNALREGVVYYDNKGIVLFCNQSFSSITGFSESAIKGKSIFELFVQQELKEKYKERLEAGGLEVSEVFEENIKTHDGNNIWVSISARPVYNDAGELIAALSTIVDITERKKQIEDIEAFSASAAHDLNAPLARIEMIALLLIDTAENQLDPENVELLQAIAGITANMRGLLKSLLQFSKLGITGNIKTNVSATELAKEAVANNRHVNPTATVQICDMPPVYADKAMLQQVFTNLISNALKYSSKKEKPLVEIGHFTEHGKIVIYVRDNGAGFDMADAPKLFAAFQRLHVEFEGNGMGLPIVKRIIEKHGGKIWADSKPGEGATFYFTLG